MTQEEETGLANEGQIESGGEKSCDLTLKVQKEDEYMHLETGCHVRPK